MKLDIVRGVTLHADQACLRLESGTTVTLNWDEIKRKDIRLNDKVLTAEGTGPEILRVVLEKRPAIVSPVSRIRY